MNKIIPWIVIVIGVLLVLPLIGVSQLEGAITDWITALGILAIGLLLVLKK
mgnify:CR=1 FL=1